MKNSYKALAILAAAALSAGCSSYDETNDPAHAGNTFVKLRADVADDAETRAGISVGESTFTGYWEDNDAMGVLFTAPGSSPELRPFTYNDSDFAFEGELPAQTGAWQYMAFYPHATVNGTKASIPFGNLRTQSGNAFNCASDALAAPILSFANAEPGKTDEGEPIRFTLSRLTSILNLEVKGGANADKVRYLLLTSENEAQTLSAESIDFDISDTGSGLAFSQTAPSNVIALGFEQGTAPDANDINTFFNIMPGSYDKLTVDVITATRIGTVAIERGADKPFAAGKLYKRAETPVFAPLEAPSFDWPGQDIDQAHEITVDDNNQLTYSAAINIHVPGGIAGLEVDVSSPVLSMLGISKLNLFNDSEVIEGISFADLGLSCQTEIQYKKECVFDITALVPMILLLGPDPGSEHVFDVKVTDLAGQVTEQSLTFTAPALVRVDQTDLWKNTASLTISNQFADAGSVALEYRIKGESAWNAASVSGPNDDGSRTALISPDWTTGTNEAGLTIHSVDPKTGIFARKSYEYQLLADGATVASGEFTPKNHLGDNIPNAGMESWSTKSMKKIIGSTNVPYPNAVKYEDATETDKFWDSGNNAYLTSSGTDKLCTQATYSGMVGNYCAQLAAKYAVIAFAAGNLYTGDFVMDGTVGYAQFGQPYTYSARPAALKLKYAAEIGEINRVKNDPPVSTGLDKGRIFVCIVEWSDRHAVQSGTSVDKTTFWDPETVSSLNEGKIIGYGSAYITESHTGSMKDLELPIVYYEKTDTPPTGNYTLVISTATSYLGDYLTGCDANKLWVDDFEWVY